MTPPNPLTELAERVQALTRACREADALIDATLRIGKPTHQEWVRKNFPVWRGRSNGCVEVVHADGTGGVHWMSEPYTTSLDAAMTLARTPQEACQATQEAISAIAKRDGLHCNFYRGSFVDDLARQVSAHLIRARAASENSHG